MIATICWFQTLRIHLDASTVVAVQRAIEPARTGDADGIYRRWREYKKGIHSPRTRVIDMCKEVCPEAVEIFRSPLWDALRLDRPVKQVAKSLVGTTSKLGDELIKRMMNLNGNSYLDPRWLRKRCMDMLRQGSLEGLAVLVICMRLAASQGMNRLAVTFYQFAGDCLLVLGIWFYTHGVAHGLGEYFETDLLPAACRDTPWLGYFSAVYYISSILSMSKGLQRAEAINKGELTSDQALEAMLKFIGFSS
jgi:hypothetical protein